jgi:hypothetical protein
MINEFTERSNACEMAREVLGIASSALYMTLGSGAKVSARRMDLVTGN